jgi:hypothetical protein
MLFQQLKNVGRWVFRYLEKSGQAIADAEDRFVESMYKKDDDERKEK